MSELTRVFGRYDKPIGLTFRKTNKLQNNITCLINLTQLTQLDIGRGSDLLDFEICNKLTNLQSLTASVSLAQLQHHTQLTELVAGQVLAENDQMFPAQLKRLKAKTILLYKEVTRYWGAGLTQVEKKLHPEQYEKCFAALPNIKHLELDKMTCTLLPGIACHWTGLESLSTGIAVTNLPVNTMTALTVLANRQSGNFNWDIAHLTNLRRLAIFGDAFVKHLNLTPFTLLESLTLQLTSDLPFDDVQLTQLISTKITHLDILTSNQQNIAQVASLINLRQLKLNIGYGCHFDFAQLSHLTQLTSLSVDSHVVTHEDDNIQACTSLTNLLELHLGVSVLNDEPLVLSDFTRLTHLSLSSGAPTVDVSNMTNLQCLETNYGQYSDLIGLSTLYSLTSLACNTLDYECCSTLTSLQALTLHMAEEETKELSKLTQLTALSIYCAQRNCEYLTRLTRLQSLKVMSLKGKTTLANELKKKLIYCEPLEYTFYEDEDDSE